MNSNAYRISKRLFDITAAGAGLIILSPLFVVVVICIKQDSRGPAFYRGLRAGLHGKPFRIFKFRTMQRDADKGGPSSTPADDPRVTRIGRVLRKYKIDELPQLLNVIRGEMSLVGPRPQVLWATHLYSEEEREILSVLPGITDLASLRFADEGEILRGSSDPDGDYLEKIHPEKKKLELLYVRTRSFELDCKLLARTLFTVVLGKTYADRISKEHSDADLHTNL
ncbi:MAG: sugar transferase [Candidatus Acidiferrales bacterium]